MQRRTTSLEPLLASQGKTTIYLTVLHVETLVITLTFYLNSPLQQMNNFFCLFVAAAAVLLTLSCAIVQWWPSSAFLLSLFAFLGLLQQSFHNPQSFSHFLILLFHFIRPPHSYLSQPGLSLIQLLILMTIQGSEHLCL